MCIQYSQCTEEPLRMYPGIFCHLEVIHLHDPIFKKNQKTKNKKKTKKKNQTIE